MLLQIKYGYFTRSYFNASLKKIFLVNKVHNRTDKKTTIPWIALYLNGSPKTKSQTAKDIIMLNSIDTDKQTNINIL